ncbi:MAG TPA: FG-GAP-like repeat-containing protein [Fluviicola sp.]|nr:FG-GAP-like repeat-containing protein [Fluviicola sp.]
MKCIVSLLFLTLSIHGFYAQSACFSSPNDITFQGPTNGQAIEKGDFDNDGKLDLVIANFTIGVTNKLNFIKGNGNGTFQAPVVFSAGTRPISLKAGDFNGDGKLDLAVVNYSPANISVVMGNGDGTFQTAVNYIPSTGPNDIEVGDFNEDSFPDLVVAVGSGSFNLFLGSSVTPGTFGTPTSFTMATGSKSIAVGDFNNDNHLDVATVNQTTANVSVRFGDGAAGFSAVTNYSTAAGCYGIATGDFNGDNLLDITTSNETADNISVLINSGAGVFSAAVHYAAGDGPNGIITKDVNGDSFRDILVVNNQESTLFTYFGVGNGTFLAPKETPSVGTPRDLVTGAFNADSYPDIAVSTFVGQQMPVYLGNASGTYTAGISIKTGNNPKSLHSNDFNGDGKKDVVVANSADNNFTLYNGAGTGQFTLSGTFSTGTLPVSIYSADLNNDGFIDVVTANSTSNNVSVFLGNGSGGFSAANNFPAGTSPIFVRIGLLNGDAFPDLAVINTADQLSVLFGTGTGSFGAPTVYTTGTTPLSLVIKDLSGDGFNDIAVTNSGAASIGVFINSGSGTFAAPVNYAVGTTPNSIDAADIDNDTDMDLVVGNFGSNNFSRLTNNGSGVFAAAVSYSSSDVGTKGVVLTDYNNDGFQDVMTLYNTSAGSTGLAALSLGNGTGVFTLYKRFAVGTTPLGIISLDANNDTRTDAAVINEINETFSVLLNTTAQVTAGGPLSFCSGNSVLLTSTAGAGYAWSNGASTPTISATTSGTYSVTTTTGLSNWCSSTSNALTVSVTPGPAAPTITAGGPTTFCSGGSVTLTSSEATGNTWSNGATTQSITVSASGTYTVTYTTGGCTSAPSNAISVVVNGAVPVITASGPTTFCTGDHVILTSSEPSNNLWSNGATTQAITVNTAGTYTVTTTVGGCPSQTSAPVVVSIGSTIPTPTISASGPTTFCSGGSVVLTSSSATDNVWSTGETTQSITVSTSGNYSVTVSNGFCSASSSPIGVTVTTTPAVPTITANGPTTFCDGDSVVLTSSSATDNLWSTGETTQSVTVFASGTYSVEVITNGCTSGSSIVETVTVNPVPATPNISENGPTTFCAGDSVILTSSSAADNVWSTGETTQSITVLASGNYTVTVDNGFCSATSAVTTVTVNAIPSVPTITANGPTTFCDGDSVVLTSSSATDNLWSTGESTQSITVSTSGSYAVEVITNGCTSGSSTVETVTVNPVPATPTISANGPLTFCAGDSVILTSSSAADNVWSTGETTQSITVLASGSYSVTVDNGFCSATSATTTVTINAIPLVPTITANGPTTFCDGDSVVLTSSSATDNLWSTGETTQSITVSTTGAYSVEVIANGCTSGSSTAETLTVNPMPATPTISANGPLTFCAGDSVILTSSSVSDNVWSTGETTQSISVLASGNYSVTVDNGFCSATSATTTVTVNAIPSVPTITANGQTTFCDGDSVILTASSATNNLWSNGETTQSITVSISGAYSVEVITNGCTSGSSIAETVTVNPVPATPTISANGPTTFCAGDSVILTSSSVSDNFWSTGETTQSITVLANGNYSVTVDNGFCSATSAATTVTVNAIPSVPTITANGPTTFCDGDSVVLTSSSATDNLWSTGETTLSITVFISGAYSVEVITNGCTSGSSTVETVTVNPMPATPTISENGPTTFCAGDSVILTSSSVSDNFWSTGETTQSITVLSSGNYSVTVDNGFCSATSAATTVTVNAIPSVPTITANGPTTFCDGDSVILTSSSATDNLWSTGETTQSITVSTSGSYSVEVIANGCTSGSSIAETVTVNPMPATPTISANGPLTFCAGDSVILTSSSVSDNFWSTGETTQSITILASGSYSVTVDNGFCSATSAATTVTVNAIPSVPTITANGPTTFCDGDSVILTSSSATDNLWSTGETTQSITVSTSGTYSVEMITNGCTSGSSTVETVTVNPMPATPTISASGPLTFCAGGSVVLTSSSATDNLWSNGATTPSITVTSSGNYNVTVGTGTCLSTSTITSVTVNPLPSVPTVTASGPTTFCAGEWVVLTSSSPANNLWSNGATTQSITVSTSGTYAVEVITNGCSSGSSIAETVTVNPMPETPTISASGPLTFCAGGSVVLTSSSATDNLWSNGATTPSITVTSSGNYNVTVGTGTCLSSSDVTSVIVNPLPTVPSITAGGPTTFCAGGSVVLTSSSPANNLWSTGATTQSITVSAAGTYTVQVITNGCTSGPSAGQTVTINALPPTPTMLSGNTGTFCAGGSTVLTASASSGYLWSTGATTQSITVSAPGTYFVQAVGANGCHSASSASATISVIALPATPTITANGPTNFCPGGSVVLTSSSPVNNLWSNGATSQSITVSTPGNYTVSYSNVNGCFSLSSLPVSVTIETTPAAPTISASGAISFCAGGSVTLTSSSPTGNTWSTGATTQSITVSGSGNYTVSYQGVNGCQSLVSLPTVVIVNALPAVPVITANGPTTFCNGGSVTLTSSTPSGNSWSNGGLAVSTTVSASGNYTVTHTNGAGCSSTSAPIAVTVTTPVTPTISASGPTTFCDGESVVLTSSIASGNVWSNGETTQSITVDEAGSFTVAATQAGCPSGSSAATTIVVNPLPQAPTITASGPTTFCEGESVFLFSSSVPDNSWSNGETDQVISVEESGLYTVSTENGFGCAATSAAVEVVVHALPVVELDPFEPVCDYTPAFTLTNGSPLDGVYSGTGVSNGVFDPAIVGISGTIITYTYTDTNGCVNSDEEVLVVDDCAKVDELSANGFEVYPNPSSGMFTLSSETAVIRAVLIYDAAGRLVFEAAYDQPYSVQLDLTHFANGVYQATILSEGTLFVRKQLVVNR